MSSDFSDREADKTSEKGFFSKKISLSDRCLSFYAACRASCVRR